MSSVNKIKQYWEDRADEHKDSPNATTNDIYLREIEISTVLKALEHAQSEGVHTVADVGCGNGYSTLQMATAFPDLIFHGYDYSERMIKNALDTKEELGINNINFSTYDVLSGPLEDKYDFISTDRCLINLPSWELQQQGVNNISQSLNTNGFYLMIENFIEGQNNFNAVRKEFDLPEIPVRGHNHFFERAPFEQFISKQFEIIHRENISSSYYLVSRVIYSAICKKTGVDPDYLDDHHSLGSKLPYLGDFGPVVMYKLRRK